MRLDFGEAKREKSPWSKIKSNLNGLLGYTVTPLRIGGLNSGLRWILTPGGGKRSSKAMDIGIGPKLFNINVRRMINIKYGDFIGRSFIYLLV